MKKTLLFLSIFVITTLACDVAVTVAPPAIPTVLPTNTASPVTFTPVPATATFTQIPASATAVPPTFTPIPTIAVPQPTAAGVQVSAGPLRAVLPTGLAYGAYVFQIPRNQVDSGAVWAATPGHTVMQLDGYLPGGKFQEPQIYVYPASDYAFMVPGAFESIHRLDNILYSPNPPAIISDDQLPGIPFFNAQQVFASQIKVLSFQNGGGVRFLTEYAQYPVSANNHDLFYHFQGVSRDGTYYIVAILPISAPMLAETSDGGAPLPPGGIPYPYFADGANADMRGYYTAVTTLLNNTPPQAFTPTIGQLDALIQSMWTAP